MAIFSPKYGSCVSPNPICLTTPRLALVASHAPLLRRGGLSRCQLLVLRLNPRAPPAVALVLLSVGALLGRVLAGRLALRPVALSLLHLVAFATPRPAEGVAQLLQVVTLQAVAYYQLTQPVTLSIEAVAELRGCALTLQGLLQGIGAASRVHLVSRLAHEHHGLALGLPLRGVRG